MTTWQYKVETIGGIWKSRASKIGEVQIVCDQMGAEGWELASVSYDWFLVQYVLFFKKPKDG